MIKAYYRLAKPGIVYGNALMYAAGFFLASRSVISWALFFEGLVGLSAIMASACVFNNVADRELDSKMERTKKRALVTGAVSPQKAGVYASSLLVLGIWFLYEFSTVAALMTAVAGFVVYVFMYTPMKPKNKWALFVGAVAGATPPVAGYTAVTGSFDAWAAALFIALFVWQIPHFLAIAFKRYDEYSAAGVPLFLPRGYQNEKEKKIANLIFIASLVLLLVACLGVALVRILGINSGF